MQSGRPPTTTHAEVERAALDLFARRGFEPTTVDDIAAAIGVSRRTIFRYFASKNDIVWGDFDWVIARLRRYLLARQPDEPVMVSLARAVVASNRYGESDLPALRERMRLITTVPALQAHSMLRYEAWRQAVAEFVSERLGQESASLVPQVLAHVCLGTAVAAFVCWANNQEDDLEENLEHAFALLVERYDDGVLGRGRS